MCVTIMSFCNELNLNASNIENGIPNSLQISISSSPAVLLESELPALV